MLVEIARLKCLQCAHIWTPRKSPVKICPKCKSKYWRNSKMNQDEKYDAIKNMQSVAPLTASEHPTKSAFKAALRSGRVAGSYDTRIVIVSDDPRKSFTFLA